MERIRLGQVRRCGAVPLRVSSRADGSELTDAYPIFRRTVQPKVKLDRQLSEAGWRWPKRYPRRFKFLVLGNRSFWELSVRKPKRLASGRWAPVGGCALPGKYGCPLMRVSMSYGELTDPGGVIIRRERYS